MNHTEIQIIINQKRRQGICPINLATGAFNLPPSQNTLQIIENIKFKYFSYTSSIGDISFREEMANLLNEDYKVSLSAENIAFVFGGTEGVYLTLAALNETRDWLQFMPGWHTLKTMLDMLGRKTLITSQDNLNSESIKKLIQGKPSYGVYLSSFTHLLSL